MNFKNFLKKCKADRCYFAEHLLYDEEGSKYKLESHQSEMIACDDNFQVYFLGRRMGKSFILATLCLHEALFRKYAKIFILSPTENQAKELAETITGLIERSQLVLNEVTTNNVLEKKFRNGSRIVIRTSGGKGNVSSVIGSGANLLVIDEIQDVGDELINKILPVLRGQKGKSKFIVAGTPRNKSGFLFESLNNSPKIWNNGEWEYNENITGNSTVFRKQTAYLNENDQIIASGTPRISIEELYEDMNNMSLIEFKQEYCLEFMSSISDVYPEELQAKIFYDVISVQNEDTRFAPPFKSSKNIVWGLDVGKMRNESVLTIAEVVNATHYFNLNGDPIVEEIVNEDYSNVKEVKYKKLDIKWRVEFALGTDYSDIEDYIAYELPTFFPNIKRGVVDATGIGEAIYEQIEKKVKRSKKSYPIESFKFTKENKKTIVEHSVAVMERGDVQIRYNERLHKEMSGYKRQKTDSDNTTYEKTYGSDDYVDSMNLCIYNVYLGLNFSPPVIVKNMPKTIMKRLNGDRNRWNQQSINKPNKQVMMNNLRRRF